ncbi:MAG TPA: hypothetical protein VGF67_01135 [Ktedonobacteraceae bacterium]
MSGLARPGTTTAKASVGLVSKGRIERVGPAIREQEREGLQLVSKVQTRI